MPEGEPHAAETQAARLDACQFRRLPTELGHQIIRDHRTQQFLHHGIEFLCSKVLRVHRHLEVANVELDVVATKVQLADRPGIRLDVADQVQILFAFQFDLVNEDFDLRVFGKVRIVFEIMGRRLPQQVPSA